jgi:hypothetical protein
MGGLIMSFGVIFLPEMITKLGELQDMMEGMKDVVKDLNDQLKIMGDHTAKVIRGMKDVSKITSTATKAMDDITKKTSESLKAPILQFFGSRGKLGLEPDQITKLVGTDTEKVLKAVQDKLKETFKGGKDVSFIGARERGLKAMEAILKSQIEAEKKINNARLSTQAKFISAQQKATKDQKEAMRFGTAQFDAAVKRLQGVFAPKKDPIILSSIKNLEKELDRAISKGIGGVFTKRGKTTQIDKDTFNVLRSGRAQLDAVKGTLSKMIRRVPLAEGEAIAAVAAAGKAALSLKQLGGTGEEQEAFQKGLTGPLGTRLGTQAARNQARTEAIMARTRRGGFVPEVGKVLPAKTPFESIMRMISTGNIHPTAALTHPGGKGLPRTDEAALAGQFPSRTEEVTEKMIEAVDRQQSVMDQSNKTNAKLRTAVTDLLTFLRQTPDGRGMSYLSPTTEQ